ncbi:MAG TPA: hypothetical protein VL463_23915 [Kofleriaceae bacterium]|nr:hypothetical protein [Kofleriaceae bacterium]
MKALIAASFLVACATPAEQARPGARGLRAGDHLEAAREHSEAARQAWPEPQPRAGDTVGAISAGPPWFYYWDARDHERLAQIHRGAAAQIEAEYQDACTGRDQAEVSPIQRFAVGGANVARGAVVYLAREAGTPDEVLADMRCHRAWMMLGRTAMDDCPLDLAGIEVVAHRSGDLIEVLITTRDPALTGELQRRVAKDVEAASSLTVHAR